MSIAEARLESIKAGLISAGVVGTVAGLIMFGAVLSSFPPLLQLLPHGLSSYGLTHSLLPRSALLGCLVGWLVTMAVAIASGFFFGVTYRYIVRQDDNLHLGGGAVGAFAFVRSLAQIEAIWDDSFAPLTWILITGESFLWFVAARYTLDWAIANRLIKPTD